MGSFFPRMLQFVNTELTKLQEKPTVTNGANSQSIIHVQWFVVFMSVNVCR